MIATASPPLVVDGRLLHQGDTMICIVKAGRLRSTDAAPFPSLVRRMARQLPGRKPLRIPCELRTLLRTHRPPQSRIAVDAQKSGALPSCAAQK